MAALSNPAAAQTPLLELTVDQCVELPGDDVRRIVTTELGAPQATDAEIPESGAPSWVVDATGRDRATRVTVACGGPRILRISVFRPGAAHSLDRRIELSDDGRGNVRLVALAIAELVQTSWAEPDPQPALVAAVASVGTIERPPEREIERVPDDGAPPPQSEPPLALRAGVVGRAAGTPSFAAGGALSVLHDLFPDWAWALDVDYTHGELSTSLGSIDVDLFSAALEWLYRGRIGDVRLAAGLGARALMVLRTPHPLPGAGGTQSLRYTGGPLVAAELEWRMATPISLFAGLEVGWILRPLVGRVGTEPEASLDGAWARLQVGVTWRP